MSPTEPLQTSLFGDEPALPGRHAVPVLGVAGSSRTLTGAQRQFNQLIERLKSQREELARWQAFRQTHVRRLAAEYQPLAGRLRERRIAIAGALDRAMDGTLLGKRERGKVRDILRQLLTDLLAETPDAELVRLHDKHADVSFDEERQQDMEVMRALAREAFGIDVEAYEGGESPEELAEWLDQQRQASRPEEPSESRTRKKSAKAIEREALQAQMAEGGTRAVREAYRKLVSELHPDRETDPAEQARKTELMQRVNLAYEAGDLLGLLELQLSIEQIDSAALAALGDERLRHYIHMLEEQSRQLRDELSELVAPFAMAVEGSGSRKPTPDAVRRALDADIHELKRTLRTVEADLARFQDIGQLKQILKAYRIDSPDDDDWAAPDDPRPSRRGRRRR